MFVFPSRSCGVCCCVHCCVMASSTVAQHASIYTGQPYDPHRESDSYQPQASRHHGDHQGAKNITPAQQAPIASLRSVRSRKGKGNRAIQLTTRAQAKSFPWTGQPRLCLSLGVIAAQQAQRSQPKQSPGKAGKQSMAARATAARTR